MEFLAENQGLGIFVAVMIAVVNAVLAFIAVRLSAMSSKPSGAKP
jgi:hypothetical protein